MPLSNIVTSATITLYEIRDVAIYEAEIVSTNGNIFKPYDVSTNLILSIHQDFQNITDEFDDIEWHMFSFDSNYVEEDKAWGKYHKGSKMVELFKEEFNNKCLIQADVYTKLKGVRTCVASARITLIDVNELYNSDIPPENPTNGMLWVDTGNTPLIIYSWDSSLSKWVAVGTTTPFVRNLIHNSNFWKLNDTGYELEGKEYLLTPKIHYTFEKNWLNLKSRKKADFDSVGLLQTTVYPILPNSDYTFSFMGYRQNNIEYKGKYISVKIMSMDKDGIQTELLFISRELSDIEPSQITCSFKTLSDTMNIVVFLGVETDAMCDFYVTELSLYNTDSYYPWELSPEDVYEQLQMKLDNDHLSVFNALTKNGAMEGIYISTDEEGNEHYFFNASHIKTGTLDGGLINGVGLHIKDEKTGESIFHVYTDEEGTHIDLTAKNLYIGPAREQASTISYVDSTISSTKETIDGQLVNTQTYLEEYADSKAADAEANSNSYTDIKISDTETLISDGNTTLNQEISAAKSDAINQANSYTNEQVAQVSSNLSTYINGINTSLVNLINQKTDSSTTNALISRVDTIDNRTTNTAIINTVTNSTTYTNNLNSKVNVSDYNLFLQNYDNHVADFDDHVEDYNNHIEDYNSFRNELYNSPIDISTIYTSAGITNNSPANSLQIDSIDKIIDSLEFTTHDLNLIMNVNNINDTDYVKVSDANIYIDNNEMIKLLLYEVKKLKQEIEDLKSNE